MKLNHVTPGLCKYPLEKVNFQPLKKHLKYCLNQNVLFLKKLHWNNLEFWGHFEFFNKLQHTILKSKSEFVKSVI